MKITFKTMAVLLFILGLSSCGGNDSKSSDDDSIQGNEQELKTYLSPADYTGFLEEILIGFGIPALQKHMVQTPYMFLSETDMLINYSAQDANNVDHFVTFHKHLDPPIELSGIDYRMDFSNDNSQFVMQYQQNLIKQLDAVYGEWSEEFQTGYNDKGLYEAEWIFEAGVLRVTVGIDFIEVLLGGH